MVMAIGGGVLLSWPMGFIADLYGTPAAHLLPAACFALVAFYGWKGSKPAIQWWRGRRRRVRTADPLGVNEML